MASEIDPKRIELSRNGPQVGFQMRQKLILNDFNVVVFSRNPEVGNSRN